MSGLREKAKVAVELILVRLLVRPPDFQGELHPFTLNFASEIFIPQLGWLLHGEWLVLLCHLLANLAVACCCESVWNLHIHCLSKKTPLVPTVTSGPLPGAWGLEGEASCPLLSCHCHRPSLAAWPGPRKHPPAPCCEYQELLLTFPLILGHHPAVALHLLATVLRESRVL